MSITINCPRCRNKCLVTPDLLKVNVRCGLCEHVFVPQSVLPPQAPPRLEVGAATSVGKVRKRNEDSYLVQHLARHAQGAQHDIALLFVADGVGGSPAGDQASALVIQSMGCSLTPVFGDALSGQFAQVTPESLQPLLDQALQEANQAVFRKGQSDAACKGMSATAAAVLVWDGAVRIGHVGDCRVYHHRAGKLTQVTKDQTLVARMIAQGTLTPAEAERHASRNEVTHAVGKRPDLESTRGQLQLQPGDWLLIACDGLQANLNLAGLEAEMNKPVASAGQRAQQLVDVADARGGSDNCTVIAVACR